ncbi:MAG: TspO/MBR family protein, partial [Pseudomonadota bacterium]
GGEGGAVAAAGLGFWAAQITLNAIWSPLFFSFRRPDWSLIENWALIASTIGLAVALAQVSSFAAWLVAPYVVWTCFAQAINWEVVRLNGPFGPKAENAV